MTKHVHTDRYHHDIASYNIPKPMIIEGLGKVKDALSSFMGNQQAAEVAGGVNIVSDGIQLPLADESAQQNLITTATQLLQEQT